MFTRRKFESAAIGCNFQAREVVEIFFVTGNRILSLEGLLIDCVFVLEALVLQGNIYLYLEQCCVSAVNSRNSFFGVD